jgi:hypothetical protein
VAGQARLAGGEDGIIGMTQRQLRLGVESEPALVGVTPREVRCSRRMASSFSRRAICWLSAETPIFRSSAARPMLPVSTMRTK